jgi:hypothetical protein
MMHSRLETIEYLHDGLVLIDEILAKAMLADDLALAARKEGLLREYINTQWNILANKAAKEAGKRIRAGKGTITDREIDRVVRDIGDTMSRWAKVIESRFTDDMESIYELSHLAAIRRAVGLGKKPTVFNTDPFMPGIKKAKPPKIDVSFDLVDEEAIESFKKHQIYWIGEHYGANVSNHVANTAREEIIRLGRGRVEAGREMERIVNTVLKEVRVLDGFIGTNKQYFEGLVANAATTERTHAQLNTFYRAGFEKHTIVNPNDHRTCEICQLLDGKEFYVSDGLILAGDLRTLKHPSEIKRVQPFLTVATARELTGGKVGPAGVRSTRRLAERGNAIPPFHLRCRCNIDITDSEPLAPMSFATDLPENPS